LKSTTNSIATDCGILLFISLNIKNDICSNMTESKIKTARNQRLLALKN